MSVWNRRGRVRLLPNRGAAFAAALAQVGSAGASPSLYTQGKAAVENFPRRLWHCAELLAASRRKPASDVESLSVISPLGFPQCSPRCRLTDFAGTSSGRTGRFFLGPALAGC